MIYRTFGALYAIIAGASATNTSGVHAELDISVIEQAKDVYMDTILKFLNNLELPNVNSDDGKNYLHGNHISVNQSANNVIFDVDVANNALTLNCNDLSANFYTDSFRAHSWIFVATGHLEVEMDTVAIGMGLSFGTQTLANGSIVPSVSAVDVNVDINRNDIDIKIWGNIWSDFASAFEIFFKSTVVQGIQDAVNDTLSTTVPDYFNAFIASQQGATNVPTIDHWFLDWQTKSAAVVTDTAFQIGIEGIMYDDVNGEAEWSTNFVDMPYEKTDEAAQFQVFISDLSVDSMMGSWLEAGSIEGWVHGDDLPGPASQYTITASELDIALPGFSDKYGADTIVDIYGETTALNNWESSAANKDITVYGSVKIQFWPRVGDSTELAVELDVTDIKFTGDIAVDGFFASANITTFLVDKITIPTSTIGKISAAKLKIEFNTVSRLVVPVLNAKLQKYKVPIPQDIFGIFTLSNIFLEYADGYMFAGATPTFIAPSFAPQLEQVSEMKLKLDQF